ncbi:hypothetical protein [Mycoplasma procyoni]|uniref:hypothetical protein n=1 Tax=Mycoplasma procyoni TaxID=568784 RepID=UPI00197C3BB7|nr:hypothetical protein [Mycoplasma procyoni]MBN3534394.1 hypothetical protein [Mycoplasma procyoni]
MKKLQKSLLVLSSSFAAVPLVAFSCSPTAQASKPGNTQTQKATNQTIDPTQYGVAKLAENIKAREFLYPAATIENFLDKDGVFTFGLHEKPLENAKGEWVALATEVKSYNNNELVAGSTPIKAEATADESKDPLKHEPRLTFKWSKATNNELKAGSYYTFIFYKKDGTEKIVYSKANLDGNKDIFPVKYTNHSIDLKANGINLKPGFKERTFLYPAATPENFLNEDGVFKFGLHEKPLEGAEGEWVAFATKVKSATDNTIFSKETPVVKAEATADKTKDPLKHEPRLTFEWSAAKGNALENGAFYTFIFYKKDGSERVVYSAENLAGNKDIFPVKASNQNIDPTKHGVAKLAENIDVRKLLHPAAVEENFLDSNGVFRFGLHEQPLVGVAGEWVAIASEVKSATDNTLVVPQTVKIATATADETKDPIQHKRRLDFVWSEANGNKLEENKFYTFVFYKKDGTQKIVFGDENIKTNKDIFPTDKKAKAHEELPAAKTTTTQS